MSAATGGSGASEASGASGASAASRPLPVPGEFVLAADPVVLNAGAPTTTLLVLNRGDRPIQVGSHYHFAEANPALAFDRVAAWGQRLDIPAGTAVRFEPGLEREVGLVPVAGRRVVTGLRGEAAARAEGRLDG